MTLKDIIENWRHDICECLMTKNQINKREFADVLFTLIANSFNDYVSEQIANGTYSNVITLFCEKPKPAAIAALNGKIISRLLIELNLEINSAHAYTECMVNNIIKALKIEIETTPYFIVDTILIPYSEPTAFQATN